ncbi:low molecular weight protein-tyrosine-phosphatase [Mesoterricola silvestris]
MSPLRVTSVLVVCEGNHCRSPMAEALLRSGAGPGVEVGSAGLSALEGLPADGDAQRLMAERGLDLSAHRGRQFTPALAMAADLILVMDERQKRDCEKKAPRVRGRVFLLGHWQPPESREIPDPYRRGPEAFRRALDQIQLSVGDWLPRVNAEQRSL